jgi:hypothetical protein
MAISITMNISTFYIKRKLFFAVVYNKTVQKTKKKEAIVMCNNFFFIFYGKIACSGYTIFVPRAV